MPDDNKKWLLESFRDAIRGAVGNDEREQLAGTLYDLYKEQDYNGAISFLREVEEEHDVDCSSIITYFQNINNDELIQEQEDESASSAIDDGDKRALLARMSEVDSKRIVGKVQAPANQTSLNLLSEQIYKKHNKLAFFISPSTTISGQVRQQIRKNKEAIDLLKVCEAADDDDKLYEFVHFGESEGQKDVKEKLTGDFYMYQFVSEDKAYIVFSQEAIDTGRVDVTGTVFSLDDVTQVGDNRKITKSTDVIFAHDHEPAITPLTADELDDVKRKADHDWIADKLLGEWRHPDIFEKLIIADLMVKDENGWPSHIFQMGPTGTGKSKIMQAVRRALDENEEMMKGEQSTIKGAVPSFSQEPPDPGYLMKCHRVACIDEFFNLLDNNNDDKQKVFRKMLTLLEHDPSNATSGNGSISVELDSTLFASTNPANGIDTLVDMAEELDEAFMARCILYSYTDKHVDFIESRKPKIKRKKTTGGEESLYPDRDDEFVSLMDTMREEVSLMDEVDFVRVSDIKQDIEPMVPDRLADVYRSRYDHHMENILLGVAKYNSLVESRDEITVTDKDYEDMRAIFEFIVQSWKENPSIGVENLSTEARLAYLDHSKAQLYRLVDHYNTMTMDEITEVSDDDYAEAKVESLIDMDMLKRVKKDGEVHIAPEWYSYGDDV